MSVVYLPEDKRWSLIGEGVGSLVGAFVSRKLIDSDNKRVAQQVQDINADDTISSQDKPYRISEVAGTKGLAMQQALLKMQQQGIVTQKDIAQTQEAKARADQIRQTTQTQAQTAPLQQQKLQGEVAAQPLQRANIASEISARETKTPLEAQNLQLTGQKTAEELQQQQSQRDALARVLATTKPPEGIDPTQWYSAQLQGLLGGPSAAARGLEATTRAKATADEATAQAGPRAEARMAAEQKAKQGTVALPTQTVQTAAGAARTATGLSTVLDSVERDPKSVGGATGYVKAWLNEHGYASSDPMFTQQLAASQQLVAAAAQSGSGFGGKWRVDLAKTISPTVVKGKVYSVLEAGQIAHDQLAYLQNLKQNYSSGQYNTQGLDASIDQMQKVADRTDSLWWTKDGKTIFYGGKQVDKETLQPVKGGASELTADAKIGNTTFVAKDVNDAARAKGLTPQQVLAALQAKLGGEGAPSGSQ